ncbi:MAG: DUF4350 domain-containing protein [Gemmatimonadota bacterium]
MTLPFTDDTPAAPKANWFARPGVIIGLLTALLVIAAVFARTPVTGREGDPRLSTLSADPLGAKLLYELADRTGWDVARDRTGAGPIDTVADARTVYALLNPTVALTAEESHEILESVRGGGALLLVLGPGTEHLSDSLGLAIEQRGRDVIPGRGAVRPCTNTTGVRGFTREALWFGTAQLLPLKGRGIGGTGTDTLITIAVRTTGRLVEPRAAMAGTPFGAGRIVVAADPDVFRNDALRECTYGLDVAAAAALDYLAAGGPVPRNRILFDEFHLNRINVGIIAVMRSYLTGTRSGNAVLQVVLAGLVLLLAAAPRVLPPRDEARVERRSPLEHVDALSRAYLQVGATRTSAARLVRGLRRRMERGAVRPRRGAKDPEDEYLARLADTKPALAGDIATVRKALAHSVSIAEFRSVGQAIQRIEAALTRT